MSSMAVSRTSLEHAHHGGFQVLGVENRTDSRRPLDQPADTTTETDGDGGRWRRDGLTLGTSEIAASLQLTTPQSEHRT